ncbi:hypothetical protein A2U01_0038042, partial [Trifolium medium]|nr:hypothetical protein [Trifolium medium]
MLLRAEQCASHWRTLRHNQWPKPHLVVKPRLAPTTPGRCAISRFTRILSDFLLPRFQGIFN